MSDALLNLNRILGARNALRTDIKQPQPEGVRVKSAQHFIDRLLKQRPGELHVHVENALMTAAECLKAGRVDQASEELEKAVKAHKIATGVGTAANIKDEFTVLGKVDHGANGVAQ